MSGFFTRIVLENRQAKQASGDTLTLSGETNFEGILKSKGVEIDASTGAVGDVFTFNGTKIVLSANTTGGDGDLYTGATPSNIEVGGMGAGTTLTGRTYTDLFEEILITTFFPNLDPPSNTFVENQVNTQEVGVSLNITFTAGFDQGSINPQYPPTSSSFRSGALTQYNYSGSGLPASSLSNVQVVNGYILLLGSNTWSSSVSYSEGVQPYDSEGNPYDFPLPADTTGSKSVILTGIYPYFYGKVVSTNPRPTAGQALLNSGTKVVATSTGTVNVNYNTTGAEWTWVAIPTTSTLKTIWYVNALSNGTIGGTYPSGNKYSTPDVVSVNSPTALWGGVNYRFYISETAGIETNIEFRNS